MMNVDIDNIHNVPELLYQLQASTTEKKFPFLFLKYIFNF